MSTLVSNSTFYSTWVSELLFESTMSWSLKIAPFILRKCENSKNKKYLPQPYCSCQKQTGSLFNEFWLGVGFICLNGCLAKWFGWVAISSWMCTIIIVAQNRSSGLIWHLKSFCVLNKAVWCHVTCSRTATPFTFGISCGPHLRIQANDHQLPQK